MNKEGESALITTAHIYKLPRVGDYILYNQKTKYKGRSGSPYRDSRGIGRVVESIGANIYIELYIQPWYKQSQGFMISDFKVGLIEYVVLKEKLYTGSGNGYTYEDLDIKKPHPDILALFDEGFLNVNKGEENKEFY